MCAIESTPNAGNVGEEDEGKKCLRAGCRQTIRADRRRRWRRQQQQQGPGAVMFAVGLKGRVFDNDDYDDGRRDCDFQVHLHPSLWSSTISCTPLPLRSPPPPPFPWLLVAASCTAESSTPPFHHKYLDIIYDIMIIITKSRLITIPNYATIPVICSYR